MDKKYIFFLGGHDAEMITIREILTENNVPFYDKNLSWGASLSDYKSELQQLSPDFTPVLVELRLDLDYPSDSIIIDHHNERAGKDKKTSLEQTGQLLGISLNRWQRLVSANDRGHIPAMELEGASPDEIYRVRKFDRKCQGVTDRDESQAQESLKTNSETFSWDTIFIESSTDKTSPLVDMLFDKYRHIFIITASKGLAYFGPGEMIDRLESIYEKIIKFSPEIIYWRGGNLPDYGFFGSTYSLHKEEIKSLL
jgi:hypothetical protein